MKERETWPEMAKVEEEIKKKDRPEPEEAQERILEFFDQEGRFLSDYAQDAGLNFEKGEAWAFDHEKGKILYAPSWFAERGFSPSEAMFASLHEIEHFRDLREDPRSYREMIARGKNRRRLHILYNCLVDTSVNREIGVRAPVHKSTIEQMYQSRLFPEKDFTELPRHLQFVYTLLREKMLPQEECQIDSKVREKIEELRDFRGMDLVDILTAPEIKLKTRYQAIRQYIEPIYEEFFQEDLEEKKKQARAEKGKGEEREAKEIGEEGKGKPEKGEGEIGEGIFEEEYDDYDQRFPEPISSEDLDRAAKREEDKQREKAQAGPAELNRTAYEKEHGVEFADLQAYQREYEQIEPYIEDLKEVFEKIIASRKEVRRRLKALKKEGAIIEPGLLVQAYIDAKRDVFGSKVWREYEKREVETFGPNDFEVTLVCDLSGSMEQPRAKLTEQRRCALLMMEVLKDFSSALDREREELALDLNVKSEVRAFTEVDLELKPLSPDLDERTRVEIFKNLNQAPGEATNDFKSLREIHRNLSEEDEKNLLEKKLRKVVIVFSDGASSDASAVQRELKSLRELGITVVGVGITKNAEEIRETYKPDGKLCRDVSQLPETLKELLKDFIEEL